MATVARQGGLGGKVPPQDRGAPRGRPPGPAQPRRRSFPVWRWAILLIAGVFFLIPADSARDLDAGAVDMLVRPEGLAMAVIENGNGIVTTRTFLGSVTRVSVLLSGEVTVKIDKPSTEAAALAPGTSVSVRLPPEPVLVAPRQ